MEELSFQEKSRRGLIVYLYYNRDAKKLKQYGDLVYHSKKRRYIQLYVNQDQSQEIIEKLSKERFVKEVKESLLQDLDHHFVGILHRDEEKV